MSASMTMTPTQKSTPVSAREDQLFLKDLNGLLTCTLCNGYFIDAMTFDCLHTFCKSCILNHFESVKQQTCPTCDKKKAFITPDHQLQALVYKMVPSLFGKETQRREDFYRSSIRASSTCSEDSVLGDLQKDQDKWNSQCTSSQNILSPEDPISLSLEFYQSHLDDTDTNEGNRKLSAVFKRLRAVKSEVLSDADKDSDKTDKCEGSERKEVKMKAERRYLQCPAAVSMSHLQKFIRMKYALSAEHRVDIIYEGEVLPMKYTLMDVAYTYHWLKLKPMRFFYRIFTPLKVQPIKIINTATSNGSKHLQIVPVRSTPIVSESVEAEKSKEQFVAQLKLQSNKHKTPLPIATSVTITGSGTASGKSEENCVFEYEEPDKEEIKRFAESRDREWARMRYEDPDPMAIAKSPKASVQATTPTVPEVEVTHHVKKRKKSKHSKGDVKKPKIHAEITSDVSQQESIKLKVKLTPAHQHNGHKHKHRASSVPVVTSIPSVSSTPPAVQIVPVPKPQPTPLPPPSSVVEVKKAEPVRKLKDICVKKPDVKLEPPMKKEKVEQKKLEAPKTIQGSPKDIPQLPVVRTQPPQELKKKEEQKAFLKTFPSNANPRQQGPKVPSTIAAEAKKPMITYSNHTKQSLDKKTTVVPPTLSKAKVAQVPTSVFPVHKVEPTVPKDKKVSFVEKPHILNSQPYPMGFTVSKVEQGVKRKSETNVPGGEKRPCLEITLINPQQPTRPPSSPAPHRVGDTPKVKRPPPATIPLDRIKKSNAKPKSEAPPLGALDLTKKVEPKNGITTLNGIGMNGMKFPASISCTPTTTTSINSLTANLQLLSKVASQHSKPQVTPTQQTSTTSSPSSSGQNKVRPQIPHLQTLRIPTPTNSTSNNAGNQRPSTTGPTKVSPQRSNLANLPKLNEISKTNLKMLSNNNNIKPIARSNNQNMIRSIPNPAMLVRQHNQSRMSLTNGQTQSPKGQLQGQPQGQPQSPPTQSVSAGSQPKILNPLAKENTSSLNQGVKEKETPKETPIHSLMNKMQSKGQMIPASTAAT